jgi:hypothetical protein
MDWYATPHQAYQSHSLPLIVRSHAQRPPYRHPLYIFTLPSSHPNMHQPLPKTSLQIKSTEDLLRLTRQLRELWIVGPLRNTTIKTDADKTAEADIKDDAAAIASLLGQLRDSKRQQMALESGGCMTYVSGPIEGPPIVPGPAPLPLEGAGPGMPGPGGQAMGAGGGGVGVGAQQRPVA